MIDDAVGAIRERSGVEPIVGVILGSGLGGLADELQGGVEIPYAEIPGWPASTAVGHAGVLVLGTVDDVPVAVLRGRVHLYEGVPADRAVFGVRVLGRLGIRTLVVTNAAGGIDESYRPGQLVLISDHVNLMGTSPLVGPNDDALGPRFPDLSDAYDPELRVRAREAAEGFVIFPGGFGTQDELWEALTLIQTGKIGNFPVVLFDSDYWAELLDWLRKEMLEDGLISAEDVELLYVTDDPHEAVKMVVSRYDQRLAEGSA